MPTPSLLIVPARFKTGTLYSQIPVPVAPSTSSVGDFTVTRNTAARRFDSAGLIASVASGIPRLDYYTSGGVTGCPALLVEPSGTNLAFHSESWAAANNWTFANVTRTTGSTDAFKAPDGTFTANAISPTSGTSAKYLFGNINIPVTYTSGTIYTQSAFFKQGTGVAGRYVQLTYTGGGGLFTQLGYANFDLQLGTVTVVSGSAADANRTARIENYGNGWYRCSFTATCTASNSSVGVLPVLITASGDTRLPNVSGTVTDVLYGWGAQLEVGSVATSYIPTTTGILSRSADVISVSGAVSGSIGQTAGVVYAQVDLRNWVASGRVLAISDGTSDARVVIQVGADRTLQAVVTAASGEVANIATASGQVNGIYKCAVAYASGDFAFYVNGNQIGTDPSGAVPACNNVALGKIETSASTNFLNDRILAGALYNTRLLNAELATLTSP